MKNIATRQAYGEALREFGADPKIIVLDADLSKSTKTDLFHKAYPDRFFGCGIAEANMVGVAAGLASCGKTVFVSSFAMFAACRPFEQIRNSVCYPRLNVKIGATHAGISVGQDGATHQSLEDIAVMRTLPEMTVINPTDAVETRWAVKAAIDHDGPVYLRLGRDAVPVINDAEDYVFQLGKGVELAPGNDITIIGTGGMLFRALEARSILERENIYCRVVNIHTIKPIDEDMIFRAARETRGIVTAEEHTVIGGLGSAVSEVVAKSCPVPMEFIGMPDCFGVSGKSEELFTHFGMTARDIADAARRLVKRG
ncbi:MAG: transketolase family protein [Synergistaceae bacterium]|jgi:transketolase|nr:transketolase family protein [Synergistaceae bacterium]